LSKEIDTWNAKFKVSGSENIKGRRNGNLEKASFNGPQSLVVYDRNTTRIKEHRDLRPIYMIENNHLKTECIYVNRQNYTKCGIIIDETFPVAIVNHKKVKYISFAKIT
jgi:hypothetical protein